MLARRAAALGFPFAAPAGGDAPDANARRFVAWCEDRVVRLLPVAERGGLRDLESADEAWRAAFASYVGALEGPVDAPLGQQLQWLADHAVSLAYEDSADAVNAGLASASGGAGAGAAADPVPADAAAEIAQLQAVLGLDGTLSGEDPLAALQRCSTVVKARLSAPALAAVHGQALDLRQFPLGFSTGDVQLDRAATVLQMIYLADLRNAQTAVNQILVTAQEHTFDARTNSSLGRVGT